MQKLAAVLAFMVASILAAPAEAAPLHDVKQKTVKVKAKAEAKGRQKVPVPGGPADPNALWWNDPAIIKALSLTDEQREKMAGYLAAYREKLPPERSPAAFHETLVQGTWKKARSENEKLSGIAETSVRMRGALKVDVLSTLNKEQLGLLVDGYPRLIYKPWMRAMRGAAR